MKTSRRDKTIQADARKLAKKLSIKYADALHVIKARRAAKAHDDVKASLKQEPAADNKNLVSAEEPRVLRSPLVATGEYMTLNSWDTADGKTRLLLSQDATDDEFKDAEEALAQSDADLEMLKKTREFLDSFEDDEEVIARCKNVPGDKQVKITYVTREGDTTQAYVHEDTGEGVNRHSNIPVVIKWFEDKGAWMQVDPWDWNWDQYKEDWVLERAGS